MVSIAIDHCRRCGGTTMNAQTGSSEATLVRPDRQAVELGAGSRSSLERELGAVELLAEGLETADVAHDELAPDPLHDPEPGELAQQP